MEMMKEINKEKGKIDKDSMKEKSQNLVYKLVSEEILAAHPKMLEVTVSMIGPKPNDLIQVPNLNDLKE